jgi:hypothetical protein
MSYIKASDVSKRFFGLNIEGGDPYLRLAKDHEGLANVNKFIWANLILVLDRPFVDHVVFEELWNDNRFALLEPRIDILNEHHFMAAFLMVIQYYIMNAHTLIGKRDDEYIKITVHLHQDPNRMGILDIIDSCLNALHCTDWPKNVLVEYLTDSDSIKYFKGTKTDYAQTDILISLSQCAGLSEDYLPGTLHIANRFVPFSKGCTVIEESKEYIVDNDIFTRLDDIIASSFNEESVWYVNKYYRSENPVKKDHHAHLFTKKDFPETVILQVDGIWNPKDPDELVKLE